MLEEGLLHQPYSMSSNEMLKPVHALAFALLNYRLHSLSPIQRFNPVFTLRLFCVFPHALQSLSARTTV